MDEFGGSFKAKREKAMERASPVFISAGVVPVCRRDLTFPEVSFYNLNYGTWKNCNG